MGLTTAGRIGDGFDSAAQLFGEIRPSIVILAVAGLAAPGLKVEIEADALI